MATRAEIIGSGPGTATIRILGNGIHQPVEAYQIQRNQLPDAYLSADGGWQTSPDHWIALDPGALSNGPDEFRFGIGPAIVDPIVGALTRSTFRLVLRGGGKTATAPLSVASQVPLLSSGARARETRQLVEPTPQPVTPPVPPVNVPAPEAPVIEPPKRIVEEKMPRSRRGLVIALVVLLLLAASGVAAWLKRDDVIALIYRPSPTPTLSVDERLKAIMDSNPSGEKLMEEASAMAVEGENEGAIFLYRHAYDKGMKEAALAVGKSYDPTDPLNSANTTTDAETASFWYQKAANANIPEAQLRLGLLQVRGGPGSETFDVGIENLKKARDQGDSHAADKLKELGQ